MVWFFSVLWLVGVIFIGALMFYSHAWMAPKYQMRRAVKAERKRLDDELDAFLREHWDNHEPEE